MKLGFNRAIIGRVQLKKKPKKQRTPKGYEIPVPPKGEFFDNLKKVSKPSPPEESRPSKGREKKKG